MAALIMFFFFVCFLSVIYDSLESFVKNLHINMTLTIHSGAMAFILTYDWLDLLPVNLIHL